MDFHIKDLLKEPVVAAIGGSILGLRFAPGLTWAQRAANAASGTLLSSLFGPWLTDLFGLNVPAQFALAAALAMFGLNIAARLQKDLEQTSLLDILRGYLPTKRGAKGD